MPVKLSELQDAREFVSASDHEELLAYVCVESGKIYWQSDPMITGEPEEELPEDIADEEKYLAVPSKRDLDLGKPLVLAFARKVLPEDFDDVREIFSRRGAYSRFKQLLVSRNALQQWYDFENAETERALREWCELNSLEVTD